MVKIRHGGVSYTNLDRRYYTQTQLGSIIAPSGASLIGVADAGGYFIASDVEAVLQEIVGIILPGAYLRLDGTNIPTANYAWTTNLVTTGTLQGAILTDGVANLTGGAWTGVVSINGLTGIGCAANVISLTCGTTDLTVSADCAINQNLNTAASPSFVTVTGTTSVVANTMTLATGSITDTTGAISFGNENLTTTGQIGIGIVPTYPLHIQTPTDNLRAVYVYQPLDITGAGTRIGIEDYMYLTGTSAGARNAEASCFEIEDDSTYTGFSGIVGRRLYGSRGTVDMDTTVSTTAGAGTTNFYAYGGRYRAYGSLTVTGAVNDIYNANYYGFYGQSSNETANINDAGSTLNTYVYGAYCQAHGQYGNETAGTFNSFNYGIYVDVDGKTFTTGNSTNYGVYIDVDNDTETGYGIYILDNGDLTASIYDEGAGHWILHEDIAANHGYIKMGGGADAGIGYDGTDMILKPDLVGNGCVRITDEATQGKELLQLDQNDADKAFIDYEGTSAASAANNISTWTTGNAIQGFVRIEINGMEYWMPFYNAPTS